MDDPGLAYRTFAQLLKLRSKNKTNPTGKMGKRHEQVFHGGSHRWPTSKKVYICNILNAYILDNIILSIICLSMTYSSS